MKTSMVNRIIGLCPDNAAAKKLLTRMRVRMISSHYIPRRQVEACERSADARKDLVEKALKANPRVLADTLKNMDYVLRNAPAYADRQQDEALREDMVFCRLAYGFQPDEYLCFGLETQAQADREQWISDLDRYRYIHAINDIKDARVLNNKSKTYGLLGEYYRRDAVCIRTEDDYPAFRRFVDAHGEFVKKQVSRGCGRGIELVQTDDIAPQAYFKSLLAIGEHILEERIRQSDVMSALNASSVNTIRCITIMTRGGVVIPYTFLKVGRSGSFIDNGAAGGILAGIDVETGTITTHGYDEFASEFQAHPDSGIALKGYAFPRWDEMKAMCAEMAERLPSVKCIGWDVTLTDSGWIVVEGNGMTQFIGPQIVYRRGIKREVLAVLKDVDAVCGIREVLTGKL